MSIKKNMLRRKQPSFVAGVANQTRTYTNDAERSICPNEVIHRKSSPKFHTIILNNSKLEVRKKMAS